MSKKEKAVSTETFIKKAIDVHGDKYDYSLVKYKGSQVKVEIICKTNPDHGSFKQTPNNHLMGQNCPKCAKEKRKEKMSYPFGFKRPKTRGDCANVPRPCPWVSCRHHLYLDIVTKEGRNEVKLNFPNLEPEDLEHSCSLDIVEKGEHTLEEVGDLMNLTRERIRQLVAKFAYNLRRNGSFKGWEDLD